MKVVLEIETGNRRGTVILNVDGAVFHKSEFVSVYDEVTDFCATRDAIGVLKDLHRQCAERSVGNRPLDLLRKLHGAVASDYGVHLAKETPLGRTMDDVKRTLDDSTRT